MPVINNIGALKQNLRENGWHMTAFMFNYKQIQYDVFFEDLDNIAKKNEYASVKLTFIDINTPERTYSIEANQLQMYFDPKTFREYFGIEFSKNLGNIFRQFFDYFVTCVPPVAPTLNIRQNKEIDRALAQNGNRDSNAIFCYDARRLGIKNGKQMNRSIFISNLTKRRKPELYAYFENEPTVTFYYSPNPEDELSDTEIITKFTFRESQKQS